MSGKTTLSFVKPGLQTTVQDLGRQGHLSSGVPVGGVMDRSSCRIANWLVGNDDQAPVLELTITGPEIQFDNECQIAITGADMSPSINGVPVRSYETLFIEAGSSLKFGALISGCRTYLAVRGDWSIPQWLNSFSASSHSSEELTPASVIQKGSSIEISKKKAIKHRYFATQLISRITSDINVGVVVGPEYESISERVKEQFFSLKHTIGRDSNRMGYRLTTVLANFKIKDEVISSGVLPGTIQITSSGQPIILMADAHTTGGYPRLGNVLTPHLDLLAQLKPGDQVSFFLVSRKDAFLAFSDYEKSLELLLKS